MLQEHYVLNKRPSVSETLAVMMLAAPAMGRVLGHQHFLVEARRPVDLRDVIIAAIVGAVEGPGADHLSRVVSSQIDADKLDYLARDAHHAGIEIGFETNRLLAKLEVLAVREDRLGDAAEDLKNRARNADGGIYYDLGIAASGFGSFEQMLIGRTFLYDRLYHHHKVRAADAMAQRLAITAQEERGSRLKLEEVFARLSDDTMIRVLGGEISHPAIAGGKERAKGLAQAILDRDLVDLPETKADAIRILARYPNDRLAVPEFSFNPVKWADAYDLQKRTGYIFCPRETVALVSLAAKLVFLQRFGVVMAKEADGYIKAPAIPADWLQHLQAVDLVDKEAVSHLQEQRYSLLKIAPEDIPVPETWLEEDPDLAVRLSNELNDLLPAGLVGAEKEALTKTLKGLFAFLDTWHDTKRVTETLAGEAALQTILREALGYQTIKMEESGARGGGAFDLVAEDRVVIENKIADQVRDPFDAKSAAATQGRRYAIALGARVVIVVMAYIPRPGSFPSKAKSVLVRKIDAADDRRVEIRIVVPPGAVVPSREKARADT